MLIKSYIVKAVIVTNCFIFLYFNGSFSRYISRET